VNVVCCQVEFSGSGRSLVQRIPPECGVSECYREFSIISRPRPTRGCRAIGEGRAKSHFTTQIPRINYAVNINISPFIMLLMK
jgi:hypothetical protein